MGEVGWLALWRFSEFGCRCVVCVQVIVSNLVGRGISVNVVGGVSSWRTVLSGWESWWWRFVGFKCVDFERVRVGCNLFLGGLLWVASGSWLLVAGGGEERRFLCPGGKLRLGLMCVFLVMV